MAEWKNTISDPIVQISKSTFSAYFLLILFPDCLIFPENLFLGPDTIQN